MKPALTQYVTNKRITVAVADKPTAAEKVETNSIRRKLSDVSTNFNRIDAELRDAIMSLKSSVVYSLQIGNAKGQMYEAILSNAVADVSAVDAKILQLREILFELGEIMK